MKTVYDIIMACRATGSKNEKLEILSSQKDNAELREFLRVTYEPRINFYQKKIDKKYISETSDKFQHTSFGLALIESVIDNLAKRKVTGNEAKFWLGDLYSRLKTNEERELLTMLIERDVRAGFSVSTINKAFGEIVTDVPYMRCCLPKDSNIKKFPWSKGVYSQIKADGMFANVSHFEDGEVTIQSRNGSPFPLDHFSELVDEVRKYVPRGYQLHGELLMMRGRVSGFEVLDRQTGNGLFNKILKDGDFDRSVYTPKYEAWDIIPISEARIKNKYKVPYSQRIALLTKHLQFNSNFLALIETRVVNSMEEANEHYREALDRGLEGTIVKSPDAIWQDSTSKDQVKMKLEFEVDLRVVGYEEGKGKASGMLGALVCESADGQLKVNVGSGFSDDLRRQIWESRDLDIITVKANSIMPPENKPHHSLFLPIFVEERLDKSVADDLLRVQEQYQAAIENM